MSTPSSPSDKKPDILPEIINDCENKSDENYDEIRKMLYGDKPDMSVSPEIPFESIFDSTPLEDQKEKNIKPNSPLTKIYDAKDDLTNNVIQKELMEEYAALPLNNIASSSYTQRLFEINKYGFNLLPTKKKSKNLKSCAYKKYIEKGRQTIFDDFEVNDNISFALGEYVDGPFKNQSLIDIDLETAEAQRFAEIYFRNCAISTMTFGRKSAHKSHYLFLTYMSNKNKEIFKSKKTFKHNGNLLLEFRTNGWLLAPPSIHPNDDGANPESLLWMSKQTRPREIHCKELHKHCKLIFIGLIAAKYCTQGQRDDFIFRFSFFLFKATLIENTIDGRQWGECVEDVESLGIVGKSDVVNLFKSIFTFNKISTQDQQHFINKVYNNFDSISAMSEQEWRTVSGYEGLKTVIDEKDVDIISDVLFKGIGNREYDQNIAVINEINEEYFINTQSNKVCKYTSKFGEYSKYGGRREIGYIIIPITNEGLSIGVNRASFDFDNDIRVIEPEGKIRYISRSKYWLNHPEALRIDDIIFDPNKPKGAFKEYTFKNNKLIPTTIFNKWTGLPNIPIKGEWPILKEFLFEVICNNIEEDYKWLIDLLAFKVQNPGKLSNHCLILHGENGVGKSFFTDTLCVMLFGEHNCCTTVRLENLMEEFNSMLEHKIFIGMPEAVVSNPYKNSANAVKEKLKDFITHDKLSVQKKGIDRTDTNNFAQIVITTNSPQNVPIGKEQRRYVMMNVSSIRKNDIPYFASVFKALKSGEINYFTNYLLFEHIINNEDPYEPIDYDLLKELYENGQQEEIEEFNERIEKRIEIQRAHLTNTRQISEELEIAMSNIESMSKSEIKDTIIHRLILDYVEFGYCSAGRIDLEFNTLYKITASDIAVHYFEKYPEQENTDKFKIIKKEIKSAFTALFGASRGVKRFFDTNNKNVVIKKANATAAEKHYKESNTIFDGTEYAIVSRKDLYKLYLENKKQTLEIEEFKDPNEVGERIWGAEKWQLIKMRNTITKHSNVF